MSSTNIRRAVIITMIASCVLMLSMGMRQSFGLFQTPIAETFGIGLTAFSISLAIQNLMWGLTQPFVGAIADKYGSGRVIAGAAILQCVGLVMLANADSIWQLHVSTGFVIGVAGAGTTWAVLLSVIARNVPENRRSLFFGIASSAGTGGQIVIAPINQLTINAFGWSDAIMILAVLLIVIVPLSLALTGRSADSLPARQAADTLVAALHRARKHSGYLYLTAGFYVCGFHVMFIMGHFPNYLNSLDMPEWLPGVAISTIGATNLIGTLLFGWLGDRHSKKYLLSFLYFARALVFAVFLIAPISPASVLIFSACLGFLWLATVPLTNGLVGQIFGLRYLAMLAGIVYASHQLGSFTSLWLGGWLFDNAGSYDLIWQISIALGLISGFLHLPIKDASVEPDQRPATASAAE